MDEISSPPVPDEAGQGPLSKDGTFEIARTDYTDNRVRGDFTSRYPWSAWLQIAVEAAYLLMIIVLALAHMLLVSTWPNHFLDEVKFVTSRVFEDPDPNVFRALQLWIVVGLSGALGSAAFALKWLYHSVAWREWNRDRVMWRLCVPIQGAMLALFTGAMIISGIIPLLSKAIFLRTLSCAGFGFFVGLFADNFLAALQKFAKRMLGTLGDST